jgi:Calcineurin-like phosphoesterase
VAKALPAIRQPAVSLKEMALCIVQLSDIHFSEKTNDVEAKFPHIAAAIASIDTACLDYLIVLSGDIAYRGIDSEYGTAKRLLGLLEDAIVERLPKAIVRWIAVPGNHDCILPEDKVVLRAALIEGIKPTLQSQAPDAATVAELTGDQEPFFRFSESLGQIGMNSVEPLCRCLCLPFGGYNLQVNLYNTALLSRRKERQGELAVPMELIRKTIRLADDCTLAISVFHHGYPWLEANNSVAFRKHIESTSDMALCGHQHFDHGFDKTTLAGERIFYSEADVLQEGGEPARSGFRVIMMEPDQSSRRVCTYTWNGGSYSKDDTGWSPYTRAARAADRLSATQEFMAKITDSGIGLSDPDLGPIALHDFFVYPDARARALTDPAQQQEISGDNLVKYFINTDRIVVQGQPKSGKTSLAHMLCYTFLTVQDIYPLLINGADVKGTDRHSVERLINSAAGLTYGLKTVERFRQLEPAKRALFIDNWDDCRFPGPERDAFLALANTHFGKVVVFVDSGSFMGQILAKLKDGEPPLPNYLTIKEMSHVGRGALMDRWLSYDCQRGTTEYYQRIEETERLIKTVLGRNTLPSLPFIVIAILEASRRKMEIVPEQGSFGYLYELLITTALSSTVSPQPQLDKKYAFLPVLAYHLFTSGADVVRATDFDQLLDEYAKKAKVKVNKTNLTRDLEASRVLSKADGNYSFAYEHYYQYFLALYFKNNLNGGRRAELRRTLSSMAAKLPADFNSRFLIFFIYLTHDDELISELILNADKILAEQPLADFKADVEFYNSSAAQTLPELPDAVDLDESRHQRRKAADAAPRRDLTTPEDLSYSDDLSVDVKVRFAMAYGEILGQVLRNFTASMSGEQKVEILTATYRLGLRLLSATLGVIRFLGESVRDADAKTGTDKDRSRYLRLVEKFLEEFSPLAGFGVIKRISQCVGSSEIDHSAYDETIANVGSTDATKLIDLAILLDHSSGEYPFAKFKNLNQRLADTSRYSHKVLFFLIAANMEVFEIGRPMRQKVIAEFKKTNLLLREGPALDSRNKRFKSERVDGQRDQR